MLGFGFMRIRQAVASYSKLLLSSGLVLGLAYTGISIISAHAQMRLPDGTYINWEERYDVKNGVLVSCASAGKSGNSCRGIIASYASDKAIYISKGGGKFLVCNQRYKKKGVGMGPPGSGGFCTLKGWN